MTDLSANLAAEAASVTNCSFPKKLSFKRTYGEISHISKTRIRKTAKASDEDGKEPSRENSDAILNEKRIYEHLGPHEGIIRTFNSSDSSDPSIDLEFANQGNLESFIRNNPSPPQETKIQWIQSLANTLNHIHSRQVYLQDVALQNILVHNDSLKLCDFGDAMKFPYNELFAQYYSRDATWGEEPFDIGCVFYSIAAWRVFQVPYDEEGYRSEERLELPSLDGVLFADVIRKCWKGGVYTSTGAIKKDVDDFARKIGLPSN